MNFSYLIIRDQKLIEFFLENGVDIDKPDDKGVTPFLSAVQTNQFSKIEVLTS